MREMPAVGFGKSPTIAALVVMAGGLAAVLVGRGCGDNIEPMLIDLETFSHGLARVNEHVEAHHGTVVALQSLPTLQARELVDAGHTRAQVAELDRLARNMRTLCTRPGNASPELDRLTDGISGLYTEIAEHARRIAGAADLTAALAEEASHRVTMQNLLASVTREHADLTRGAAAYSCRIHNA